MVKLPEEYPYSSHRGYIGLEEPGISDVDPVLRLFGSSRAAARSAFIAYVLKGMGIRYSDDLDSPAEGHILGSDEFVDETIHRIGDTPRRRAEHTQTSGKRFDAAALVSAVATVFGIPEDQFCGPEKSSKAAEEPE